MSAQSIKADEIIKLLNLLPHSEGGYYNEIYRNSESISKGGLPERYNESRNILTSIYFLLKGNDISKFHILKSDEIWYFHSGSPVIIHKISLDGKYEKVIAGLDVLSGEKPQVILNYDTWFGAELLDKESYALVSCAVAPGFDFKDFKLADKIELLSKYPAHSEIINRLT